MKPDMQIESDVTAELAWDPAVNATSIGVAVQAALHALRWPWT